MPDKNKSRWLSVDEIAAHLGIQRGTVYEWIATRGMELTHLGLVRTNGNEADELAGTEVALVSQDAWGVANSCKSNWADGIL